ncbi:hypothetical protein BJV82DRAFT_663036 [Fennellomyces sp. T-0311]|nr:hypothetical protein BJV82DRAFT_663036 [Fennellomyces sp. T-0311]
MPRPQSSIWQYFTIVEAPDGKGRKSRCNYCNHQQACGVTRLHQHLLRKCTKIPVALKEELLQKEAARGRASLPAPSSAHPRLARLPGAPLQQQQGYDQAEIERALSTLATHGIPTNFTTNSNSTIRPSTSRYDTISSPSSPSPQYSNNNSNSNSLASSDPMSQRMLDYNLARALFSASIPFTVVNNPEFATFLKRMRPGYIVPKTQVLQQYLLKEEHFDLIQPDQPSSSSSPLPPSFDSSVPKVIAPRSPSSSSSTPSTSSAATISRIIHAHSVSNNSTSNSASNPGANDATAASTSRMPGVHRPPEMDGSL